MMNKVSRAMARAGAVALLGLSVGGVAGLAAAASFDEAQTKEMHGIIHDYLVKNPEVIKEAVDQLHKREEEKAAQTRVAELGKLYTSPSPYSTGPGDVTVVEFFDYNCGYCRRAFTEVLKLLEADKKVRVVFVEFPILSEESRVASKAGIAAGKQGKYFEFHKGLLGTAGHVNEEKIFRVAADAGLNVDQLKKDMNTPETDAIIDANLQLGEAMSVRGTPAFFVGDRVEPGAPEDLHQKLQKYVEEVRKNGCAACGAPDKKS